MASDTAALAREAQRALNTALKTTSFSCKLVSWDDVCRSQAGGSLSAIGPNITDTYLRSSNGASLYTVRSDNWNEQLGLVSARDIILLIGNCNGCKDGSLTPISLDTFLDNPYENGAQYSGLTGDLSKPALDTKVSIRFQTVFLPLGNDVNGGDFQFASEAYNYQTSSDSDPRNIILLATTQGLSVQAGAAGIKRLLLHHGTPDNVKAYWMKAEASRHKVGAEQKDTPEERADSLARGSATSERFGVEAMGTRFNALMTIQIPLLQANPGSAHFMDEENEYEAENDDDEVEYLNCEMYCAAATEVPLAASKPPPPAKIMSSSTRGRGRGGSVPKRIRKKKVGTASAARISRGSFVEQVQPLTLDRDAVRHPDEHITVTVVLYHAVRGGVPSAEDARAAAEELERMYAACDAKGKLAEEYKFDSVKFGAVINKNEEPIAPPPIYGATEPKNGSPKTVNIVMKKIEEFATAQKEKEEKWMELKLVALGAIEDGAARHTVARKFAAIQSLLDQGNTVDEATIQELKLLMKGALSDY